MEFIAQLVIAGILGYIVHLLIFIWFDAEMPVWWAAVVIFIILPSIGDDEVKEVLNNHKVEVSQGIDALQTAADGIQQLAETIEAELVESDLSTEVTNPPTKVQPIFEDTDTFDYSNR